MEDWFGPGAAVKKMKAGEFLRYTHSAKYDMYFMDNGKLYCVRARPYGLRCVESTFDIAGAWEDLKKVGTTKDQKEFIKRYKSEGLQPDMLFNPDEDTIKMKEYVETGR